jgi:hypothetical protein
MATIQDNDHRTRRCPRLGHDLQFSYCRKPGSDIPCSRIYDCWWETFDIKAFMNEHYGAETLAKVTQPQQHRVTSLFEMIQQAQQRAKENK